MIKLHIFTGFENPRLGIRRDTLLGHLYSDRDNEELLEAVKMLGLPAGGLQDSRGFYHFDLWGEPLDRARLLFKIVNNHEIYADMKNNAKRSNGAVSPQT